MTATVFIVRSSPGRPLTVGFSDVAQAFAAAAPGLRWALLHFHGFRALAARYEAVVECFDSGYWRFSIADGSVAEAIRSSLERLPDVHITEVW
jgi:hypothetical protein